jgi:hypothetical protein
MRGEDRKPFEDDDIAHLERLMPHITRALQLRRAFFRVDAKSLGLQATVDRLRAGVVLLDEDGAAIFINTAMKAIAQRSDGFSLDRNGRPLPANIEARRRFDRLLEDVTGGGSGGILTMQRMSGARDYVVLIAPSPSSSAQSDWEREGPVGAIVLLHDPEGQAAGMADMLEQGLSLPKGAARLVAALAADDDLKSFAESEGVTIHTARFHLRTALARTGARTQAELVRLAVRLLRDFALAEPNCQEPSGGSTRPTKKPPGPGGFSVDRTRFDQREWYSTISRRTSAQPLHHQIDDRNDHGEADQARRRYRAGEFHHVVGYGFDEHAGAVAEDQIDQDHRQDRQKSEFDEQPEKAPSSFEQIHHHPASPILWGGELALPTGLHLRSWHVLSWQVLRRWRRVMPWSDWRTATG